ncbi:hypothetical protein [Dokdonia sp.]|uniref:hypothetical protein n=1 Tax=Dokdonia sp. TaxID=2024995 RepID=UPI003267AE20
MDTDKNKTASNATQDLENMFTDTKPLVANLIINNNSSIRQADLEKEVVRILEKEIEKLYKDSSL